MLLFSSYSFLESCQWDIFIQHSYLDHIDIYNDKDYELLKSDCAVSTNASEIRQNNYLYKAMKSYDKHEFKKCLDYIDEYDRSLINYSTYTEGTHKENAIVLSYKAHSKKALKSYKSALKYCEELIEVLEKDTFAAECVFSAHFEYGSCLYALGLIEKGAKYMKKLASLDFGLNLKYLKDHNYALNHQPCFHVHNYIEKDKMMINEIVSTVLGKNIVAIKNNDLNNNTIAAINVIPLQMTIQEIKESDNCSEWCNRLGGYAAVACAFIPNKALKTAVLIALAEMRVNCVECCQKGLGHEHCCKTLKNAILNAMDQAKLDNL